MAAKKFYLLFFGLALSFLAIQSQGTLVDMNGEIMRGTPMTLSKSILSSRSFATEIENWRYIKNNGFNTIRVCWVDPWYEDRGYQFFTVEEVLPYLDLCVSHASELGMNIIINYHNVGEQEEYDTGFGFSRVRKFWEHVAPRYNENERVYYEITNEPVFNAADYTDAEFLDSYLSIYDTIRLMAPERQILLFSFWSIGADINGIVETYAPFIDWDYASVAYHMYNSTSSSRVTSLMEDYRVICTEWDYDFMSAEHSYVKRVDGYKENSQTLEHIGSSWTDWRSWSDNSLDELLKILIPDAREKGYWWGVPVPGLKVSDIDVLPLIAELEIGDSILLELLHVFPALAEDPSVTFMDSDTSIALIDSMQYIHAVSPGETTILVLANGGDTLNQCHVTVLAPVIQSPYPDGLSHPVPGNIPAVHFDRGGEGVSYHDKTPFNLSQGIRPDEAVDTDYWAQSPYITHIEKGEWLEYSIHVLETGPYLCNVFVASNGDMGRFHLELNSELLSDTISVANTGSSVNFFGHTISNLPLDQGDHVFRFVADETHFTLSGFEFRKDITGNEKMDIDHLKVFPNPAADKLMVKGNAPISRLALIETTGKIVKSQKVESSYASMNVSRMPAGYYILMIVKGSLIYHTPVVIQ